MHGYRLVFLFLLSVLELCTLCQSSYDDINDVTTHSRRKRYLVFPDGSTFSIAFCVQWGILDSDPLIFTEAVNWAVSYELPNQTIRDPDTKRLVVPYILRRNRRELYHKLETAMHSAGLDGRACINRALCEATQRLKSRESFSQEMLRVMFLLPQEEVNVYEPIEHHEYDAAYRRGLSNRDCPNTYSTCPFSLLDVFLSAPKYEHL